MLEQPTSMLYGSARVDARDANGTAPSPPATPSMFSNILFNRFRQRRSRRVSALLLAVALAGCATGPAYEREDPKLSAQFGQIESAPPAPNAAAPDAHFWNQFDDPLLAQLVEDTLSDNFDLQVAVSRLDRARALLRGQRMDLFPTVLARADGSDSRVSAADAPGVSRADRDGERYELGIAASWELDLFGRVRQGIAARGADFAASEADVAALRLALTGELARTYLELRGLQTRLRVASDNATNQQQTLQLVSAQLDAGMGTDFDLVRARSQLEATRARVPALQGQVARAMHRLAVLTGREPAVLLAELSQAQALPEAPAALAAGTPGDLLRRRPDIAAAELRMQAATARIGVASADLFPRFTLAGLLGTSALDSGALFARDSESRSIALGIDWSFLDRGRVRSNIDAAKADTDGAVAQYRQTVLLALEEVENALVGYGSARQEDTHLSAAASDSERAAELAHIRFDAGAVDLLEVLDAERIRLQAQDQLADARTRSVVALVQLYVALGGGA